MAITKIKTAGIENGTITADDINSTFNISSKTVTLPSASVTAHVTQTDLQPVKSDISALALREATNESSAAFNLPNQFIDTFATDTIGTKTDVAVTGGYVSSASGTAMPTGTVLYLKGDQSNTSTTFTDTSSSTNTHTINVTGNVAHSNAQAKIGSTSILFDGSGDYLAGSHHADFTFGTGEFNLEAWIRQTSMSNHNVFFSQGGWGTATDYAGFTWYIDSNNKFKILGSTNNSGGHGGWDVNVSSTLSLSGGTWYHFCTSRGSDGKIRNFLDGVEQSYTDTTGQTGNEDVSGGSRDWKIGSASDGTTASQSEMYMDNLLIAKGTGSGRTANFTPTTSHYGLTTSATGTAIQAANTVGSAKTKVGGTMLYKDLHGTATLGTDLKIYFTCDGGSNWTEATSYNAITPVYSTGIKQVRLGQTTCTSGTDVRYKAVWANQASGSKETQLHGIGVNY